MKDHQYYVYILTTDFSTLTYTGVTNDLKRRVWEYKEKLADSHTKKYRIDK